MNCTRKPAKFYSVIQLNFQTPIRRFIFLSIRSKMEFFSTSTNKNTIRVDEMNYDRSVNTAADVL